MAKSNYEPEVKKLRALAGTWSDAYLAGGAITSIFTDKPVNDLDLYFKSFEAFSEAVDSAYEEGGWCVSLTHRAITFALNHTTIQLMYFSFFDTPEAIFESFDFTCCMAALPLSTEGDLAFHPRFVADAMARRLVFNPKTAFPIASGVRVRKYQEKGFTIAGDEWVNVLMAINFAKVDNWEALERQIGGHYGNTVRLTVPRDTPFTLEAVIAALKGDGKRDQLMLDAATVEAEPPATYEEAMKRIAVLREANV